MKNIIILVLVFSFSLSSFAQMQKLYSKDPLNRHSFGGTLAKNNNNILIASKNNEYDNNSEIYNMEVFVKKNKLWKHHNSLDSFNLVFSDFSTGDALNYNSKSRFIGLERDSTKKIYFIYDLNENGEPFLLDSLINNSDGNKEGVGVPVIYKDWIFNYYLYFDFNDFKRHVVYEFYHYEEDSWVLKNDVNMIDLSSTFTFSWSINDRFAVFGNGSSDKKGNENGEVIIFENKGDHWALFQKLYQLDAHATHSWFGMAVNISSDSKYIGIYSYRDSIHYGEYSNGLYVYRLENNKYEYMQKLSKFTTGRIASYNIFNIENDELLIGAPERYYIANDKKSHKYKGAIDYYKLKEGKWVFYNEIHPANRSDTLYREFGRYIVRDGETALTNAPGDYTYYYKKHPGGATTNGAAYVFQIPARDTLNIELCEGESYMFGDMEINKSGHYVDTLMASYGVDSVVQLYVNKYPKYRVDFDTILCGEESIIVGGEEYTQSGFYEVDLKSIYGCDSIVSFDILKNDIDTSSVTIVPDFGCENGSITVELDDDNASYVFNWSNGAKGNSIIDLKSGDYELTISDGSNCEENYLFTVGDSLPFMIPNAFFPDGQQEINQSFRIYLSRGVEITSTQIFNRWGEKVYESVGNEYWEGRYKGKAVPPGVYLYRIVIDTPCGEEVNTGQVMLLK